MFKIQRVKIIGFWGDYTIESDIFQDVNIYIGKNGTGKTTFINLLQAALTVDLELLFNFQFELIEIILFKGKRTRKIEITKQADTLEYRSLLYKIGTKKFKFPVLSEREYQYITRKTGRLHPKFYRDVQEIREVLDGLIQISYLSVYRDDPIKEERYLEHRREIVSNIIDLKLDNLLADLTSYQLQLETELTKLSVKFQADVLRSMLFNEDFDHVDVSEKIKLDLQKIKSGLERAYKGLGILDSKTKEYIKNHVNAISVASDSINSHVENTDIPIYVNDVTPLTLLRRSHKIIELSNKLEEDRLKIYSPINKYINLLNKFNDQKTFHLSDSKEGGLKVSTGNNSISFSKLSSGEKQLIILLTETLLQKNSETVFIADEPELSLHIEWQRKIVPSIRDLNYNAQIILATHSPEIVGKWKNNTINMANIIHG